MRGCNIAIGLTTVSPSCRVQNKLEFLTRFLALFLRPPKNPSQTNSASLITITNSLDTRCLCTRTASCKSSPSRDLAASASTNYLCNTSYPTKMPPKKATTTAAKAATKTASTTKKRRAEDEADDAPKPKRGRPIKEAATVKKTATPKNGTTSDGE